MDAAIILILIIILAIILFANLKIVPQADSYVVERLGSYLTTWESGLHMKIPIIDRISKKVSIKEQVADFPPQPVITKDNVTMQIDTIVFYQVTDAKLYTYGVERPQSAIENLTATTLRNIIGDMELDNTLTSRDEINTRITTILDTATDKWGIKVNRVEVKNILPPREIQDAMERQMKAERLRREAILTAEGEKRSQILVAEGQKESEILRAEAERQATILRAEAAKQATILNAEADKEAQVRRAQGESEAIVMVQKATAQGINMLNESAPTNQVLALESFKSLEKVADGKATKIIIPSEIQSFAGLASSFKELVSADK